jgi:hypothetical protein
MIIVKKKLCQFTQVDLDRLARIGSKVGTVELMSTIRQAIYYADLILEAETISIRVRNGRKKIPKNSRNGA